MEQVTLLKSISKYSTVCRSAYLYACVCVSAHITGGVCVCVVRERIYVFEAAKVEVTGTVICAN